MVAAYPNTIPSFTTKIDNIDVNWASDVNRLQSEVAALALELGIVPKAGFASVAARLEHLQQTKSDVGHGHDERYIRRSLATHKGMLVASSGPGNFVGLSPGQSGQALVSDGSQEAGVRWHLIRHDDLPGLGNDDHPQYLTTGRHNALDHIGVFHARSIRDLGDVANTSPQVGAVLKWNGFLYSPGPESDTSAHGSLSGLANDDHPQYLTSARHHNRATHDAIGLTHNSLTGLTAGHPHTQYPRKDSTETLTGAWNWSGVRPTVVGDPVVTNADGGRKIFVRSATPTSGVIDGDIWIRP